MQGLEEWLPKTEPGLSAGSATSCTPVRCTAWGHQPGWVGPAGIPGRTSVEASIAPTRRAGRPYLRVESGTPAFMRVATLDVSVSGFESEQRLVDKPSPNF